MDRHIFLYGGFMSTLIVEITKVLDINKHPNADKLELITVKGWQVVAQKDLYKIGDLVIYCPIDAVLPVELSDKMDVTKYLSKGRVKTVKLRGEYSQGLLIPISFIDDDILKSVFEGEDVKEVLGITKYEPAIPIS
jgi:RNA ligase (TIGR02306 family)